jgi:hypothetical protein
MTLVIQRLALVLMLALGMSTVWVAASAWTASSGPLAAPAHAEDDDGGDDDGGQDDSGRDDDGSRDDDGGQDDGGRDDDGSRDDDAADDDRDDRAPEGGVETGGGGTSKSELPAAAVLVPASLAGLATVGGGLLLWRRRAMES